jgi:serine/threonine-protein kinase RsbT
LVASELATNLLRHTPHGGEISLARLEGTASALVLKSEDHGPGIADVAAALRDGFSTAHGLGGGLPTVRRFSDELEIETTPDGTSITVRRRLT